MIIPKLRWLRPREIRAKAESFLDRHHPSRELPIPIEDIADAGLDLDIIPLPGLKDNFESDAFLSNDLTSIYVDEYVYEHYENRYRFTLCHELGHLWLHDYIYKACDIRNVDDFHRFNEALDPKQKSDMETQANMFAGYVLAPDTQVVSNWKDVQQVLCGMIAEAKQQGFEAQDYEDNLLEAASERLCGAFQVSSKSMKLRLLTAVRDKILSLPR